MIVALLCVMNLLSMYVPNPFHSIHPSIHSIPFHSIYPSSIIPSIPSNITIATNYHCLLVASEFCECWPEMFV
eukprot:NODE_1592_length_518_cov_18.537313_g1515_i0.p3 GENE.NODE_1592_length_518_cov_18.537313_g1515_i0~~NODE_1592_length_518_cov_18.537313_g1515_i0.p3  ORF type:complete len:73 (+),score=21.26 NODE_1592_length_518_cov_18.537313_g1515_i0:285-503(+)